MYRAMRMENGPGNRAVFVLRVYVGQLTQQVRL